MDFMSTVQELAGVPYPKEFKGHTITPTDGQSLVPVLKGKQRKGHEYLFFEHIGGRAVRWGDWKLVTLDAKKDWELYNIRDDRTEVNNLAAQHPQLVEQLKSKWMEWARASHVLPKPNAR